MSLLTHVTNGGINHKIFTEHSYSTQKLKSDFKDVFPTLPQSSVDTGKSVPTNDDSPKINDNTTDPESKIQISLSKSIEIINGKEMKEPLMNNTDKTEGENVEKTLSKTENETVTKETISEAKENPFADFDITIDESVYLDAFVEGSVHYNKDEDVNHQNDNATGLVDAAEFINTDPEEYIPVFTTLVTAERVNDGEDASKDDFSNRTLPDSQLFKEGNRYESRYASAFRKFCSKPSTTVKIAEQNLDPATVEISDDSDEDNLPISLLKNNCDAENGPATTAEVAKEIDRISIIDSEENFKVDDDDPCNGYHSSDFEFISESEALMNCPIKPRGDDKPNNKKDLKKRLEDANTVNGQSDKLSSLNVNGSVQDHSIPGPSNVLRNETEDISNRSDHIVPEGENFLALFQGRFEPELGVIDYMANKAFYYTAGSTMQIEFEGVGFDMSMFVERNRFNKVGRQLRKESKETADKIRQMYLDNAHQ